LGYMSYKWATRSPWWQMTFALLCAGPPMGHTNSRPPTVCVRSMAPTDRACSRKTRGCRLAQSRGQQEGRYQGPEGDLNALRRALHAQRPGARRQDSAPHGQRGQVSRVARDFRFLVSWIAHPLTPGRPACGLWQEPVRHVRGTHLEVVLGAMSRQKVLAACTGSKPR
jgi:hypothetical protein